MSETLDKRSSQRNKRASSNNRDTSRFSETGEKSRNMIKSDFKTQQVQDSRSPTGDLEDENGGEGEGSGTKISFHYANHAQDKWLQKALQ